MTKEIFCPDCGCKISGDYMSADAGRRRFFACLRDAHANLPDRLRDQLPNAEVLRKHALIAVGHCDVMTVVCGSKSSAPGIAKAFMARDQYCIAIPRGDVVIISTARSMARRVLLKRDFMEVADKVFHWIAETTGVDPGQSHEGRKAA